MGMAILSGAVLDLPEVGDAATAYLADHGLNDRCAVHTCSFFDGIPIGYDVHLLKWILHDWDDEACGRILAACRDALPADGRLVIVERLVPETISASRNLHAAISSDLTMLVNFGAARERRLAEFQDLLAGSGFTVAAVTPLKSGCAVLVCDKQPSGPPAAALTPLCTTALVPPGEARRLTLASGDEIALFNVDGTHYAISDTCPHQGGSLALGEVDGDEVLCPLHFQAFHIPSGESRGRLCKTAVQTYPIVVEQGVVYLEQ